MRIHWIAAIAALAVLGGCNSANQDTAAEAKAKAAVAIAPGTAITGAVTLRDPIAIGPGAKLQLRLVDVGQPEPPLADKTIDVSGAPPYNFSVDFDRTRVTAERSYVLNATLVDGERRFLPALTAPVLTHGSGANVQIILTAEATPAEKLKEEYGKLQGRIGGMKKVAGTYTTDTASIGWDAFAEGAAVRFLRVNTELDAGGRSAVYYAYTKEGKLMVVQQKGGAMVGWGDNGETLVNEKHGGGEVGQADISSMRDAAMKALQMAQEKVDAARKK
jgi:putative lipoprotein